MLEAPSKSSKYASQKHQNFLIFMCLQNIKSVHRIMHHVPQTSKTLSDFILSWILGVNFPPKPTHKLPIHNLFRLAVRIEDNRFREGKITWMCNWRVGRVGGSRYSYSPFNGGATSRSDGSVTVICRSIQVTKAGLARRSARVTFTVLKRW